MGLFLRRFFAQTDGITFTPASKGVFFSRFGAPGRTDGTGIFIDDDGTGYVAFASMPPGFDEPGSPKWAGHVSHGYGHIVRFAFKMMIFELQTTI